MIQLIFSLRFQSQLRRTRTELLKNLEKSIVETMESYGGTVKVENKLVNATFNKETIGFWLDIFCQLETIKSILEKASSELYGHVCIIGEDINEIDIPLLTRAFPSNHPGTGIWCAASISESLQSFIDFDDALTDDPLIEGYSHVRSLKELGDASELQTREKHNAEKIRTYLKKGASSNAIIAGDERIGKRAGLYRYCEEQMKGFPPLFIRFKAGVHPITSFIDSFTPEIQKTLGEELKTLQSLHATLFQERLREELSDFTIKRGQYFLTRLLAAYKTAAEKNAVKPMVILEDIQEADTTARLFFMENNFSTPARERIKYFGTATKVKDLESWEELFPRIIKFTPEKTKNQNKSSLPHDLWEMGYCCDLLERYFPPFLIPQLLQEEGKNPVMIEKSLALLSRLQAVEPIDFNDKASEVPGARVEHVQSLVRRRLLACVKDFRLKPCFLLLTALADLGFEGDNNLVLDSICADIINGTFKSIEKAITNGSFSSIAGKEKALVSIVNTQKALSCGNREDNIAAFKDALPGTSASPVFQSKLFANAASYYIGVGDTHAANDAVKEGMLLSQNENAGRGLDRMYRLFSLVAFSNQRLSDAIDYFSFAIEHAEKAGNKTELSISCYYSAVAHFIFGNISNAKRIIIDARKAALEASLPDWADRSRFLEGRLYFESGLYQAALDIFNELSAHYLGNGSDDFKQTVNAWIYRANIYLNNTAQNAGKLKGLDAQLFITEATFIKEDYRKTLELVNKMEQAELEERFVFIEQPDWRSGFNQCELLLFPQRDLWNRMIHTFKALALCHIEQTGNTHNKDEAIREMQHIIRNDLPETDLNDAFYLYSYFRILKLAEAPDVDMNTAISLAFKRLQKRASRIDDNETKRIFLSSHYWNSALASAAKEYKLI